MASLQYGAGSAVHHFGYEHWCSGPEASVRLFLLVPLVLAVEVVALAVEAAALVRHLAGDAELLGHRPVQFFARFVHDLRALEGVDGRRGVGLGLESRLQTKSIIDNYLTDRQGAALLRPS